MCSNYTANGYAWNKEWKYYVFQLYLQLKIWDRPLEQGTEIQYVEHCLHPRHKTIISVIQYVVSFQFCNHLDWEERVGCFTLNVFLVSSDCVLVFCGTSSWCYGLVCSV